MGESTRKNPDRYIDILKDRIEWLRDILNQERDSYDVNTSAREEEIARLQGKHWFSPSGNSVYSSCLRDPLGEIPRLNQEVIIRGRVTELKRKPDKEEEFPSEFTISLIDVSLKED